VQKRMLVPPDLLALAYPGDIAVSPNGELVAYTVTRLDQDKDESKTDLYLFEFGSGNSRRLTYGGKEGKGCFSPDSSRLAFVSGRDGKSQIYIIELAFGGEPWRLTTEENVAGNLCWFPCGTRLAYSAKVFSQEEGWQPYPGAPEGDSARLKHLADKPHADKQPEPDKKENLVKVVTRFSYRRDGSGYFGDVREHVFVREVPIAPPQSPLPAEGRRITSGDFDYTSCDVSPDGSCIVTSARRSKDADYVLARDLWVFPVDGGTEELLYAAPSPTSNPRFSPCGEYVSFLGHAGESATSTTTGLYLLPFFGQDRCAHSDAIAVTKPIDRPALPGGFWQGKRFVFPLADQGCVHIYAASVDGTVEALLAAQQTSYLSLAGAGKTLAYIKGRFDLLEEIWASREGAERALTAHNMQATAELLLAPAEHIAFVSEDGQALDGWLLLPPDQAEQTVHPLMLFIHGGPHGWYGPRFMLDAQVFAALGYAVLLTNPRGSESYGQRFADIIDGNWGDLDCGDVLAAVKAVNARGVVDQSKLFAQGWSYGGYLACWLVTRTTEFNAVCAGAPVSNLLSGYGTSDITLADEREYGGKPWESAPQMLRSSPVTFADRVETPFMLMHGENDLRCPVSQSEEFYTALKRQGKDAVLIRYPGESHGLKRPLHRLDKLTRQIAWFEYHRRR